jgi:transcriptional regulator with XRE-family HTH domain
MAQGKARNLTHISRDIGYRFVDRDPILELVANAITDSGLSLKAIENRCGVTSKTIAKWMNGGTRRPQNLTIEFVLRAIGYRRAVLRPDGTEVTAKKGRKAGLSQAKRGNHIN